MAAPPPYDRRARERRLRYQTEMATPAAHFETVLQRASAALYNQGGLDPDGALAAQQARSALHARAADHAIAVERALRHRIYSHLSGIYHARDERRLHEAFARYAECAEACNPAQQQSSSSTALATLLHRAIPHASRDRRGTAATPRFITARRRDHDHIIISAIRCRRKKELMRCLLKAVFAPRHPQPARQQRAHQWATTAPARHVWTTDSGKRISVRSSSRSPVPDTTSAPSPAPTRPASSSVKAVG